MSTAFKVEDVSIAIGPGVEAIFVGVDCGGNNAIVDCVPPVLFSGESAGGHVVLSLR